ncbi:MAG: ornithine carbamoyltransferase [Planctomycetota bacterium]|nr:ornithine carbamoyltransferase [Planctomycetota bacterium]
MQHLRTLFDLQPEDVLAILDRSTELKNLDANGQRPNILENRLLTQIYDKPSLRTRLSFNAAMIHLGGQSEFFTASEAGFDGRESLPDIARVVSSISDAVVLRTFSQKRVDEFAAVSQCPVINGLSDEFHPCQALTDFLTIREELGGFTGQHLVYVGDGNNVAASLAIVAAMLGVSMTVACPTGFEICEEVLAAIGQRYSKFSFRQTNDIANAVKDATIIYTDVWASMGQEGEAEVRRKVFAGYQVNEELMSKAPSACRFMHDLPARRGLEVTDGVMDGPQSIVFQQAENRMHLAKGLLAWLIVRSS